jgi:hypothetical protein
MPGNRYYSCFRLNTNQDWDRVSLQLSMRTLTNPSRLISQPLLTISKIMTYFLQKYQLGTLKYARKELLNKK